MVEIGIPAKIAIIEFGMGIQFGSVEEYC